VIKLRALGDVIMATPVLENLRQAFPSATIEFLTETACAPVVHRHPALDEVIVLDRQGWRRLPLLDRVRANLEFIRRLRRKRYDLVIDLFGNPRSALLTLLSGAKTRVGYRFRFRRFAYNRIVVPRGDRVHEVEFNLDAVRALGVPVVTTDLRVATEPNSATQVQDFWQSQALASRRYVIGLNASGGWYTKRWPLQHFAELGDQLQQSLEAQVVLIWGPGEIEDAREIANRMHTKPLLAPATDVNALAILLARLDLLVSNDSGPLHLAVAMKTPVVGFYGPTRPELQGPWGERHEVAFHAGLPCLGCNGVSCNIGTHDCMQNLSVGTVMRAVQNCLGRNSR